MAQSYKKTVGNGPRLCCRCKAALTVPFFVIR